MGLSPGKSQQKVGAQEDRTNAAIDNVGTVDPIEAQLRARTKKFMDWQDSTDPNKNILDAPGISDYTDIYGAAENAANQEMMGSGAGALANPANAGYTAQLKELSANNRYNDKAAGISNALQGLKADNLGMANSAIQNDFQRKSATAGLEQNQLSQYYNRYKIQNPWYQKLWNAGLQGVQVASKAYAAR